MNTTLELPLPCLSEGCFASVSAFTDSTLFESCGVRIAFTERRGGESKGAYSSLNLGALVDDDSAVVEKNRNILFGAFDAENCFCLVPRQIHSDKIFIIPDDARDAISAYERLVQTGGDAIIVEAAQVAALLCFADCVPVIIVSPSGRFAVVHAGWRGVINEIAPKAFACLRARDKENGLSLDAHSYNVYIGPYIHAECFETGEDVAAQFFDVFGAKCVVNAALSGRDFVAQSDLINQVAAQPHSDESQRLMEQGAKPHIDLGSALRTSLYRVGVVPERVAEVGMCTVCNNDRFFSYRAQNGVCGRHGAFAVRM